MHLQIQYSINTQKTATARESADFISRLSQRILQDAIKHKPASGRSLNICFEGLKKLGKKNSTVTELWTFQLMQIQNVSEILAQAIATEYPSCRSLMHAYTKTGLTTREKEELLANVSVKNQFGETTSRRIGPVLSKKIYEIFTCPEEYGDRLLF
eukprot:TRINITY_DN6727_c0_g1_i1.p1 TRINITY_DN6727_c0_g1~~TRINITY_DN6727_c0_g1_i1.p1  ORF type:complete len:155 (+),score=25.51 TRINITY_DN6727_c0_g1_i1:575-1039(+)